MAVIRKTRPVSWIVAALRELESFPVAAQSICLAALSMAAEGGKAARRPAVKWIWPEAV